MRNRSNSAVRLDFYQRMVFKTILQYQDPVTGLLPATPFDQHAWVRENVYSALAIWALSLAYKKSSDVNEDRARCYELQKSVVKLMRGLLFCMMQQKDKVERFKVSESVDDAIHAKFNVKTRMKAVGDNEWGHLQLDATSLYLLILAEMTATGLQIIYTLDEVAFIQNLVFYIHCAYTTPDFGIWERGDKSNTGLPELNCTSVGMAKAALEAMSEMDLFGRQGCAASVIHVLPDDIRQCRAILNSVLPRESNSKETDAGLLSIISYPAFAVDDQALIRLTKDTIVEKLQGQYGLCRFLRDGYKTPKEDSSRLYYEPWELQSFENIECEWPLFFTFLILDGLFNGNKEQVEEYSHALEEIMIKRGDGIKLVPELYAVPKDKVDLEYEHPKSQEREPMGKIPLMWAQSLYVVGRLLKEGFLSPGELDPLNRRFAAEPKYETVIQIAFLAEDYEMKQKVLSCLDIPCLTFDEVAPIRVFPARILNYIYSHLGRNQKLGMSGINADVAGILATSQLYTFGEQAIVFLPRFLDQETFYLVHDLDLVCDILQTNLANVKQNWTSIGRPLFIMPLLQWMKDPHGNIHPSFINITKKLLSGYKYGTNRFLFRVQVGTIKEFRNTSAWSNLSSLVDASDIGTERAFMRNVSILANKTKKSSLRPSVAFEMSGPGVMSTVRRRSQVSAAICQTHCLDDDVLHRKEFLHIIHQQRNIASGSKLSKQQTVGTPSPAGVDDGKDVSPPPPKSPDRSQAPDKPVAHLKESTGIREKITSTNVEMYAGMRPEELIGVLGQTSLLHEQADIIYRLYIEQGLKWTIEMDDGTIYTVRDLMTELYNKAAVFEQWWLVRHSAGILGKRVEELATVATDIIVQQKQLTVGLPPEPREKIISRPLPIDQLESLINEACGEDKTVAMLTQEVLVYLAMFFVTDPKAFDEMIRIRVGLLIQVMVTELAQMLNITVSAASEELMNLSPFEVQTFLSKIISAKEYTPSGGEDTTGKSAKDAAQIIRMKRRRSSAESAETSSLHGSNIAVDRLGRWLRRRQLDGSLSRVPVGFCQAVWNVLNRCPELLFERHSLVHSLIKESTAGEMKFAIQVESVLNQISSPEYRQLMVEATMVLSLVAENLGKNFHWDDPIDIGSIVHRANAIFLDEQERADVVMCCATIPRPSSPPCKGHGGICMFFYDSAPTGRYGTMVYMIKAATEVIQLPIREMGTLECIQQ